MENPPSLLGSTFFDKLLLDEQGIEMPTPNILSANTTLPNNISPYNTHLLDTCFDIGFGVFP